MTSRHTLASAPAALLLLAGAAALLAGCPGGSDPHPDAGPDGDGGAPVVELGTGGIDVFEPIADGDTVELVHGCQGAQHVWIGVRAWGLDTQPALIALRGTRVSDGEMVSLPITVRLRFTEMDDYDQITGLQLVIPDPDQVLDQEIEIGVQVSEDFVGGRTISVSHRVNVVWGDEVCGVDYDGGPPAFDSDAGAPDAGAGDAGTAPDAATGDAG